MTASSGQQSSFRVAVFAAPDDLAALAEILEQVLKLHPTDAMNHARAAPGLLCDPLQRDVAERLAVEIGRIGLQAEAVAVADLPQLDHAAVVHHARCLEGGLEIVELHGQSEQIVPWSDLDLISLGDVPGEMGRHYATGEMATMSAARRTSSPSHDRLLTPGPEAWFICRNPLRAMRIDHKRMNYESLGPRKTDSATANFRLFLDDVIAAAPQVYLTPATRAYAEHGSVEDYTFANADELRRATLLHWLIHRRASRTS